jgi:hypothetical protein
MEIMQRTFWMRIMESRSDRRSLLSAARRRDVSYDLAGFKLWHDENE